MVNGGMSPRAGKAKSIASHVGKLMVLMLETRAVILIRRFCRAAGLGSANHRLSQRIALKARFIVCVAHMPSCPEPKSRQLGHCSQ